MRPKQHYYAAFKNGYLMIGSVMDKPAPVRRYIRAMFADKVEAGCYPMNDVFKVNGITVEKIMVTRLNPKKPKWYMPRRYRWKDRGKNDQGVSNIDSVQQ